MRMQLRQQQQQKSENTVGSNRSSHAINLRSPLIDRHISSQQLQQQQRALTNVVPPFRPIHQGGNQKSNHAGATRITKIRGSGAEDGVTIVAVPAFASLPPSIAKIPAATALSSQLTSNVGAANNRRISVRVDWGYTYYLYYLCQRAGYAIVDNQLQSYPKVRAN